MHRGSVLILLLWVLLFLSTLACGLAATVRQSANVIANVEVRQRLRDIASSGALLAIDSVSASGGSDRTPETSSFNDFWYDDSARFNKIGIGEDGAVTVSYYYTNSVDGTMDTRYGIVDEERKINVNYAGKDILENIFLITGDGDGVRAAELANAVVDWRDADDALSGPESGLSEAVAYSNAGLHYSPPNARFRVPEELLLVNGMDPETFARVKDYITVFGDGKININTVSKKVLLALGLPAELADKIVYYRAGPDNTEGTADDIAFSSLDNAVAELSGYCDLSKPEKDLLKALVSSGIFCVVSNNFTARAISELKNKSLHGKLICVFDKSGTIKYWSYR